MANRTCPGCGMNDDHPRHILVAEDGNQKAWHTDCHKLKGCEICKIKREGAEDLVGDEYRQHLLENTTLIQDAIDQLTQAQLETAHGTGV